MGWCFERSGGKIRMRVMKRPVENVDGNGVCEVLSMVVGW